MSDWHPIKGVMYDVNETYEQAETEDAQEHIDAAVYHLKQALKAEIDDD